MNKPTLVDQAIDASLKHKALAPITDLVLEMRGTVDLLAHAQLIDIEANKDLMKFYLSLEVKLDNLKRRLHKIKLPAEFTETIGILIEDIGSLQGEIKHHKKKDRTPERKMYTIKSP